MDGKDVKIDVLFKIFQIRVVTYDACNPVQKAAAFVRVTVVRNENRPVFGQTEYLLNIDETEPLGVSIAAITATDDDEVCRPSLFTPCLDAWHHLVMTKLINWHALSLSRVRVVRYSIHWMPPTQFRTMSTSTFSSTRQPASCLSSVTWEMMKASELSISWVLAQFYLQSNKIFMLVASDKCWYFIDSLLLCCGISSFSCPSLLKMRDTHHWRTGPQCTFTCNATWTHRASARRFTASI